VRPIVTMSAPSSCWMIGRTVTIALALMVERNPLAPIAVSASHFVRPGTMGVSMTLEVS
jgi:hypothetical protein